MSSANKWLTPEQIKEVTARSDKKGAWLVIHAWAVIFGAMALFAFFPNPLTFLFGVVIIGARQLGLAVLSHDGAHGVLFKTPWINNFVSQWFVSFPVLTNAWPYRRYHLQHHKYTQQEKDPDLVLSAPFPITRSSLLRKIMRALTGQTGYKQRKAQIKAALGSSDMSSEERELLFLSKFGGPLVTNLALFGVLALSGHWHLYFVLWLLPLLTWYQLITRIRNIAEHAVVPSDDDVLRSARTTLADPVMRAILAPYYVNYHVEHHMIMYVPCYNLALMHKYLGENGWHDKMEIQPDYFTVLKMAVSKPEDGKRARDGEDGHDENTADMFSRGEAAQ